MANGKVEGMVGYARRNFMVPFPRARDFDELNAMLLERCQARQSAVLRGADTTIGERVGADRAAFLDLPATSFDACDKRPARGRAQIRKLATSGYRTGQQPGVGALQEHRLLGSRRLCAPRGDGEGLCG
jgi:hypothetical protein